MNTKFTFIFLLLYILSITACKNLTEITPPDDKITADEVFKHDQTATTALQTIYALMVDGNASPYLTELLTGLGSDELTSASNTDMQEFYTNTITPSNVYSSSLWSAAYRYIYLANTVYQGCGKSTSLDPAVKKQLMAEARFIRAFWYFYLGNIYGDIPLPTTPDHQLNAKLPRTETDIVYQQVIADLIAAQADLNEEYVGRDSKTTTNERVRPNKSTATALLARVYLYMEKYNEAEQQASLLINETSSYALVPLREVFLKNSKEAIWQLMASSPNLFGINTHEGAGFILNWSPLLTGQSVLSSELIQKFEEGDIRKNEWIGSYRDTATVPFTTWYYPHKYKIDAGSDIKEYTMVFRLGEQYLIRAEARAKLGKLQDAVADIDVIRQRAGLSPIYNTAVAGSQTKLIAAIMQERETELFTEGGHRWFDLKRTSNINSVMTRVCRLKNSQWNTDMQLWPIPSAELSLNPNLVQNEGYN